MKIKFTPSLLSLLILIFIMVFANFNIGRWNGLKVIDWDVVGFYAYLPATFIYHDYKLKFVKDHPEFAHERKFWPQAAPNGGLVIKPTMGLSFMYLPFFFIAHFHSQIADLEANGFTILYHKYIHLSALFYLIIGLFFLRKLLIRWFSEWATAMSLFSIVLGTNLFYYATTEASMSHAYTFSICAVFLYSIVIWYDLKNVKIALLAGILFGLMILIRPVNIVFGLFPLFYGMRSLSAYKERFQFLINHSKHLSIFFASAFIVLLPQFLYWKSVTGHFLFYSYLDEHFYFLKPKLLQGLFSFRNGWLIYSPIMLFSMVGLYFIKSKHSDLLNPIRILFPFYIYLVFSWWCWWYVGFGNRAMIDSYAILAISLATCYEQLLVSKSFIKYTALVLLVFLIGLNAFQTLQYRNGLLHFDGMNFKAYKASFGTLKYNDTYKNALLSPDYEKAKKGEE
ncbi:MAG: hypothetical protein IPM92_15940 [Saprospiraceae bacterium]|nr:hypothetical protein [Saprospiraceae bacterium]